MEAVEQFAGLASDSREVKPGYLFAALPGSKANGAQFLKDAVARGAIAVLGPPEVAAAAAALGVRFIAADNPRQELAYYAARFFAGQPSTVAAVTGTNGKTSITVFLREIWTALGKRAASMGTIGVVTPTGEIQLNHTTPGPIELHRILAGLKRDGIDYLAVEASSHGLDQFRLDGADIAAVRLHQHHPRPYGLSPDLRGLSRLQAAAVPRIGARRRRRRRQCRRRTCRAFRRRRQQRGLQDPHGWREGRERPKSLDAHAAGRRPVADVVVHDGKTYTCAVAAGGRVPGLQCADGRRPSPSAWRGAGEVFAALAGLKGAPGRLEKVAYRRRARRSMSITPTRRTRWKTC